MRPYPIVPEVVIEVVSPNDRYSEIGDKVQLYLSDGVRLVLVIDPQQRNVAIHGPDMENPIILRGDGVFADDDVLPGFNMLLIDLFKSL
jgi:Uma2 family endonuclease